MIWVEVNPGGKNTKILVGTKGNSLTGGYHPDSPLIKYGGESITVTNYGETPGHNWVTVIDSLPYFPKGLSG